MNSESNLPIVQPVELEAVHLPALIGPIAPDTLTALPDAALIPALIANEGDPASWRYVDFFTTNIRNPNTRRAYARACGTFFAWCEERGLGLTTIRPFDVSTYIESRQQTHPAPDVKQQLSAYQTWFGRSIAKPRKR